MSKVNLLRRFWRLLIEENYESLFEEIEASASPEPRSPEGEEWLFLRAMAQWRTGRLEDAARSLESLVSINSQSVSALQQLGNVYDELEQFDKAEAAYAKAHALAPDYGAVLVDWGIMLCRSGEHEEALERFEEAERLCADDDNLYLYRGSSLESLGEFEDARDSFEEYLARGRRDAFALGRLGVVYSELGQFDEAESVLREAIEEQPDELDHQYNLAMCLRLAGHYDEARDAAEKLTREHPENAAYWGLMGDIALELRELDEARIYYSRSLDINPHESYSISGLGWRAYYQDDFREAERLAREALVGMPGNSSALELLRVLHGPREGLHRFSVEICGELIEGVRFFKSMDCLAVTEDEAESYVRGIQAVFDQEAWWDIEEIERAEPVQDECPGICWISDYDIVEGE
ncbi:MAG: cellulose synthase subunit BcsC [candidate division BRC1 bacterium ADurb.BinA364]|nr:MAG: cellulose synthase subunit BcsC [candidate division BRC1 bacterium ADurb.BinA364]